MAEKKDKQYVSGNAQLMIEWNWELNTSLGLNPKELLTGSNKKAWWTCRNGHTWDAVIVTRVKGSGCPFCSNRRAWKGFNDLLTTHPFLASQWHPTMNGQLSASDVTSGSDKKVWWRCPDCGHEWESRVANRTLGNGCPVCRNAIISKKVSQIHLSKSGSLKDTHPQLAKQWHTKKNGTLLPTHVTAGSAKAVWWIGECGHEWKASPSNRSKGTNCPYCSNQKVLRGFNDLTTLSPDIAMEWHPNLNSGLLPADILGTSNKKVWWQGKCGHEWEQKISNRTKRLQGCPICAKRSQTSFPEQALFYYIKKKFPEAVNTYEEPFNNQMELDIFIPSLNVAIEYDGANWHDDYDSIRKEQEKHSICVKHGIKLIRVREAGCNAPLDICDIVINAQRHPTPKELDATILEVLAELKLDMDVDTKNDAIEIRENYLSSVADKSLLVRRPDVAATWHPTRNGSLTPDMFTERSGVKVWWLCPECGNEWETAIATRSSGAGCRLCGYKKRAVSRIKHRIEREGSLADNDANLAKEWHHERNGTLSPNDVMRSSGIKAWWKCEVCGHEWEATVNSRARGNGCPACARKSRKRK